MKKTVIFATLLTMLGVMSSCIRDDDWELFKHPIHVQGSVDPHWGIPVAYGEMNFSDLLSRLSAQYNGYVNPDSNIITVEYQGHASDTIYASSFVSGLKAPRPSASKSGTYFTKDSVIVDTVYVDFFDDVNSLEGLYLSHVWLDLKVRAWGDCPAMVAPYVKVQFDSLEVWYDDHYDAHKKFTSTDIDLDTVKIIVDDVRQGFYKDFPTIDMARVVNDLPKRVYARYHMKVQVSNDIITQNIASMPISDILDSLSMTKFIYEGDLAIEMPLEVRMDDLFYTFDVDLGEGLSGVNLDSIFRSVSDGLSVDVGESKFRMKLDNGIPLNLTLTAKAYEGDPSVPSNLRWIAFNNETIASAELGAIPGDPIIKQAVSPKTTMLEVDLDSADIEALKKCTKMRVSIMVATTNHEHVAIKRNDFLKLSAFIQVHPTAKIDIVVTENGIMK